MTRKPSLTLYLIRHGHVSADPPGAFYGGAEIPLSPQGREEARQAARSLRTVHLDRLVSSPLSRALFGARVIQEGHPGLQLEQESRIREIDRGRWVGLTPEQVEASYPGELAAHERDPRDWRAHGGESLGDLQARVLQALKTLRRVTPAGTVALVSHLWPIRAILAQERGLLLDLRAWEQVEVPTGSVHEIHW